MTGVWYSGVRRGLEQVITTRASAAQILRWGLSVGLGLPPNKMVCLCSPQVPPGKADGAWSLLLSCSYSEDPASAEKVI